MSAVVRIRPDLEQFRKELIDGVSAAGKQSAEGLQAQMAQAGDNGGKAAGDGLADGVRSGSDRAKKELSSLEDRAKRIGDGFGKMQSVGAKMSLGITAPLVLLGKQSLDAFSEFQDASAAAAVFYGDQVTEIETFSEQSAKSFGVSKRAAFELANGLAPLLQQFTSADQMGSVAVDAIARTADMASFFGGSVDEAAIAVQSFLSGSSVEPIRRFGVFASAAAVEAKAISMGLVESSVSSAKLSQAQARLAQAQERVNKLTKDGKQGTTDYQKAQADVMAAEENLAGVLDGKVGDMSDAVKIQARYAILMEQTSQAAGDFSRTSDSLANSTKATRAAMEDQAVTVGEQLAPHMQNLQEHLLDLLERFSRLPEGTQKFIIMAGAVAAVAGPVVGLVGTIGKLSTSLLLVAARWMGVTAAASTAAGAQAAAGAAGANAARMSMAAFAGKAFIGAGAFAAGYGIGSWLNNQFGISDWLGNKISGLAEGGVTTTQGVTLVGEEGPELLTLPRGAEVRPLDKVGGSTYNINVQVTGRAADDPAALARELDRVARRASATVRTRRLP
jgi:hypothetical protein